MDENFLNILTFALVGLIAQIIDGSLGMAYGVSSTTFLLSTGITPAVASASVHTAQVFTTSASGLSHLKLGNVDSELVRKLVIPGIIGGVIGVLVLIHAPGDVITPFIAVYLLLMGVRILYRAARRIRHTDKPSHVRAVPLGLAGGFFDAVGGGGWGPIVTSTLIASGHEPRMAIGSANLAEFFVTAVQTATFFTLLGPIHWQIVVGLVIGGVPAAPLAAWLCTKIPPDRLMIIVGTLIVLLSLRTIILVLN